jgi:hypothetical protein
MFMSKGVRNGVEGSSHGMIFMALVIQTANSLLFP